MPKDRENSFSKSSKHNAMKNCSITEFIKKQSEVVSALKAELQNSNAEKQQIQFIAVEKNKCLQEVQKFLKERDEEIKKLKSELASVKNEHSQTLNEFYAVRQKFYELETIYDTETQNYQRHNEEIEQQLSMRQSKKDEEVRELTEHCDALAKEVEEERQISAKLNRSYAEIVTKMEQNHQEFMRQQKTFEDYKQQMDEQCNAYNEKANNAQNAVKEQLLEMQKQFDREKEALLGDLVEKDEIIKQYIKETAMVKEEKDRQIKELNYKISQIEKVFVQPTKTVAPMVSIPDTAQPVQKDQQVAKSAYNVAITKPQQRQETSTSKASTENRQQPINQLPETSNRLRSKKPSRFSYIANKNNNNRVPDAFSDRELLRNPSPPPRSQSTLYSSSTEDDDTNNDVFVQPWVPNRCVPETETDASESFYNPKRLKK